MRFSIQPKGPFNLDLTLQRYRLFGEDAAHAYRDGVYHRVTELDGRLWVYALYEGGAPSAPLIQVQIFGGVYFPTKLLPHSLSAPLIQVQIFGGRAQTRQRAAIESEIHRGLGLDLDLEPFYNWGATDPILADLITRCHGMRIPRPPTPFESLVTSISAQQVNLGFATLTRSRLVRRFGQSLLLDGRTFYAFPTPESLAHASLQELREMQFSWRKAEYIVNLATLVTSRTLRLEELPTLPNEVVIERITQVKGLGRWTADWLLARGLGRGDVIAAGDLGVRKAVGRFYFGGQTPSSDEVRSYAARWGAFQNLTVHYLLAGLRLPDPTPGTPPARSPRRRSKQP